MSQSISIIPMGLQCFSYKVRHSVQSLSGHLLSKRILPVWRIRIKARLSDIGDFRVTALSTIKVEMFIIAVHVTHAILLLLHEGRGAQMAAVSTIMACQRVVTLRVTVLITNLADVTVGQDEAVA